MDSRYLDFKKSFQLSIQSLLSCAVSKEDVHKEFSMYTDAENDNLYRLFNEVIKALHENIAELFESRCQETQVFTIFEKLELLLEEQKLDILHADESCIEEVKEKVSTLKMDKLQNLKSLLQKVEEQNTNLEAQIQSLKANGDHTEALNAVEKIVLAILNGRFGATVESSLCDREVTGSSCRINHWSCVKMRSWNLLL